MAAIIVQIRIVVTMMMMVMVMMAGHGVSLMRGVEVEVSGKNESIISADHVTDQGITFVLMSERVRLDHILLVSQYYHFFLRHGKSLQMESCGLRQTDKRGRTDMNHGNQVQDN
jgi:hypothetical protein